MYPPIVCFCGKELGCIYALFSALRTQKYIAEFGDIMIDPKLIPLTDELQIDLEDIYDKLHLAKDCCRTHIMAWVEFKELY